MIDTLKEFVLLSLGLSILGTLFALPHWVHVLDEGKVSLRPSEVAAPGRASRHVELLGRPLVHLGVLETKTRKRSETKTETVFVPIVDEAPAVPGAAPSGPVHVLYRGPATLFADLDTQGARGEPISGVVRDALWEGGVSGQIREILAQQGVELAPDYRVVTAPVEVNDRAWAYLCTLGGLIVGLVLAEQRRSQRVQAAATP